MAASHNEQNLFFYYVGSSEGKHEWLQAKDYENLKTLEAAIDNIILKFGIECSINFF